MAKRGITSERAHIIGPMGGRPKGRKNKSTLLQEVVKKKFDQKVLRLNDRLLNAQASLAVGQQFLYKIEKEFVKTGTKKDGSDNGYWKNLPPKLVSDEQEIFAYIEMLAENNGSLDDDQDESATYYFITAKEPRNDAIDSLRNRVFGKPTESLKIDGTVKFSLRELAQKRQGLLDDPNVKVIDAEVLPKVEPQDEKEPSEIS